MENLHKIKKIAKSYTIQQQPKYQKYLRHKPYNQQQYQPSSSQTYRSFKQQSTPRSSQTSSAATSFCPQALSKRHMSYWALLEKQNCTFDLDVPI